MIGENKSENFQSESGLFGQTLIIIPTYNENENVGRMIHAVYGVSADISILIVDDGSPDGTADTVKRLIADYPRLYLIERPVKGGLGSAYVAGFRWALEKDYCFIFEMDCDFSHDPSEITNFLKQMEKYDLVLGSRYLEGIRVINWPLKRLLLSFFASLYTRWITKMPIKDPTSGFKCFRRSALACVDLDRVFSNGYCFQIEISYRLWCQGRRLKEIPIIFQERKLGESKMNKSIIIEAAWGVVKLRLKRIFKAL